MNRLFVVLSMSLATSALVFGCTSNVEDPTLNQTGRTGNTTCVTSCDTDHTSCVAKCTDDMCKASCETTHTSCTNSCAPADGG